MGFWSDRKKRKEDEEEDAWRRRKESRESLASLSRVASDLEAQVVKLKDVTERLEHLQGAASAH